MATTLTAQSLRCEYLIDPLAVDAEQPRLSWTLESSRRGHRQIAYQILVATSPDRLTESASDLWDSGRVEGGRTSQIPYAGRALAAGECAWWTVRVWDQDGAPSEPAQAARWERGLAHDDWHGAWIGQDDWNGLHMPATPPPGAERDPNAPLAGLIPSPYLRTSMHIGGSVRRARIYATAKGVYELRLNGNRVGDKLLTPGWTDYDRRIQYQAYDVTGLLTAGENALGAILAPGWYSGYVGFGGECRHYGSRPQLLLEARIEYEDGRIETVTSDDTWRASTGPIRYADPQMGERHDARAGLGDWDRPGYDDSRWQPVAAEPRTTLPLVADLAEPVQLIQELAPLTITEPAQGVHIVDLGQNIAGWARLRLRGPAGTEVRLRFAEMLDQDGSLYVENLRAARATDTFVLAGEGEEIFEPRFTFHGFRYVELTGFPGTPTPDTVTGCAVASNTPWAGSFHCSSELVNQLQRNIEWGQRGNFLSIPTDCPQRDERLGWTGDGQVFVGTACYNADAAAFYTKWMVDVEDAQSPAGGFPNVAPRLSALADGAPAWGDAGVIVPWTIYRRYGDTAIVRRHYAAMGRWMEYLRQANPGYLRIGRLNSNYGDWLSIDADTPGDVLATAYWAYDARLMAEMAETIGESADAVGYRALFERIKAAFIAAYVDEEGHVAGRTQTAYVMALQTGLLPERLRAAAAAHLVEDIKARDWHLSTGFVGVSYLCPVLSEAGYLDVAYRLLTNETFPSWGYSIRQGATTIWERWDGYTHERGFQTPKMNSFNHYSLGSVGEWLFREVAGIDTDPEGPGFSRLIIRPRPGGEITAVQATYRSMHGPVTVAWKVEGGAFTLAVSIPANTSAMVSLPTTDSAGVRESADLATRAEGVRSLGVSDGRALFAIGSGNYLFSAEMG